jgi:hypothetical protein
MGLSFTTAASPRQRSYSRVRVPRNSWPHFIASDSRLLQHAGPGPCIYISQEQGGSVGSLGTGFPFSRLLRLAGIRRRYSTPQLTNCEWVTLDSTPPLFEFLIVFALQAEKVEAYILTSTKFYILKFVWLLLQAIWTDNWSNTLLFD